MTGAEDFVLAAAGALAVAALVERRSGALGRLAGGLLLAFAVLAVAVALLHMEARVMAAW